MQIKRSGCRNMGKGRGTVLASVLWMCLCLCSCTVSNTPNNTFYERTKAGADDAARSYTERMDKTYDEAFARFMDPDSVEELEGDDLGDKLSRKILGGYQRAYYVFRTLSPVICISSMALGLWMMLLSTQNKRIKRIGLFVFIIGIPIAVLLIVFGVGIFNGIVLY